MPVFWLLASQFVRRKPRQGLRDEREALDGANRASKQRTGARRGTYAYWHLRKLGYVFIARGFHPAGAKGEIDLIGYDGETPASAEVRIRTVGQQLAALPELSGTAEEQHVVARTARRYLVERHVKEILLRFDVLPIGNIPGSPPEVRLRKDAFSPQMESGILRHILAVEKRTTWL